MKKVHFIGVEDVSGVAGVIALEIYDVFALGVTSKCFALWVTGDVSFGIAGVVAYEFAGIVSLGYAIYVTGKVLF